MAVGSSGMRFVRGIFPVLHFLIAVLFALCGVGLIGFSGVSAWYGIAPGDLTLGERLDRLLQSLAVLTVALAALELGQTIVEEQVQRETHMSGPTRVRRFLSRFMVVLVVALAIESLVLVFRYSHAEPSNILYAALVGISAAALMIAWGFFVRLNTDAEELEPEAMEETKAEDAKV